MATTCTHLDQIQGVEPSAQGGEGCMQVGDTWMQLRECLVCGHAVCSGSPKYGHATQHFHETEHPIIKSFERGEYWRWCYVDEVLV